MARLTVLRAETGDLSGAFATLPNDEGTLAVHAEDSAIRARALAEIATAQIDQADPDAVRHTLLAAERAIPPRYISGLALAAIAGAYERLGEVRAAERVLDPLLAADTSPDAVLSCAESLAKAKQLRLLRLLAEPCARTLDLAVAYGARAAAACDEGGLEILRLALSSATRDPDAPPGWPQAIKSLLS
jgi:hypothetical protein